MAQLIGHGLVTHFNRQTFEEETGRTYPARYPIRYSRERRFTLADVEAVITAPEFFRDGNA